MTDVEPVPAATYHIEGIRNGYRATVKAYGSIAFSRAFTYPTGPEYERDPNRFIDAAYAEAKEYLRRHGSPE